LLICWQRPSFEPHSSWSVFADEKGKTFVVRRLQYSPEDQIRLPGAGAQFYGAEAPLDGDAVAGLFQELDGLVVPVFEQRRGVLLDGIEFGVQVGNRSRGAHVTWNSGVPEAWEPLNEFFSRAISLFDRVLPMSTLREFRR
jgi:hypothetical protein